MSPGPGDPDLYFLTFDDGRFEQRCPSSAFFSLRGDGYLAGSDRSGAVNLRMRAVSGSPSRLAARAGKTDAKKPAGRRAFRGPYFAFFLAGFFGLSAAGLASFF